ncbi:hypothetical protein DIPPA_06560 [Diplonema papillatum]|nr:hypothetical protein DIPPA_06560 [Diplonema papillatum]
MANAGTPEFEPTDLNRRGSDGSCGSDAQPKKRLAGRRAPTEISIPGNGKTVAFYPPAPVDSPGKSPSSRSLPTPTRAVHQPPAPSAVTSLNSKAPSTKAQQDALLQEASANEGEGYGPSYINLSPQMLQNMQNQHPFDINIMAPFAESMLETVAQQQYLQSQNTNQRHTREQQQGRHQSSPAQPQHMQFQQQHQQPIPQHHHQQQHQQSHQQQQLQQLQQLHQQQQQQLHQHQQQLQQQQLQQQQLQQQQQQQLQQQQLQQHHHQQSPQHQPIMVPQVQQQQQSMQPQPLVQPHLSHMQSPPLLPNHGLVSPPLMHSPTSEMKRRSKDTKKGPYATHIITPGQIDEPMQNHEQAATGPLSNEERQLVIKVSSCLLDKETNKFAGSLPVVVVQRVVTEQAKDEYEEVVDRKYGKSFHKFLTEHKMFKVFHYRQDAIDTYNLMHCTTHEGRVAFSDVSSSVITNRDAQTAKWKSDKWAAVLNEVEKILQVEPLQMKPLMARFKEPELNSLYGCVLPSNHSLRQLLRKQPDRFVVLPDSFVKLPSQLTSEEETDWLSKRDADGKKRKQQEQERSFHGTPSTSAAASASPLTQPHSPVVAGMGVDPAAAPVAPWGQHAAFGGLQPGMCGDLGSFSLGSQRSSQGMTSPHATPVYQQMQQFNNGSFSPQGAQMPFQCNSGMRIPSSEHGTPGNGFGMQHQTRRLNLHESPSSAASTPASLPNSFNNTPIANFYGIDFQTNFSNFQSHSMGLGSPYPNVGMDHGKMPNDVSIQSQLTFPSLPPLPQA